MTAADFRYYREGWTPARMDCCGRLALDYNTLDTGDDVLSTCKPGRGCLRDHGGWYEHTAHWSDQR